MDAEMIPAFRVVTPFRRCGVARALDWTARRRAAWQERALEAFDFADLRAQRRQGLRVTVANAPCERQGSPYRADRLPPSPPLCLPARSRVLAPRRRPDGPAAPATGSGRRSQGRGGRYAQARTGGDARAGRRAGRRREGNFATSTRAGAKRGRWAPRPALAAATRQAPDEGFRAELRAGARSGGDPACAAS